MKHNILLLTLIGVIGAAAVTANATDLRGRIDGVNPYTQMAGPLPGIGIALYAQTPAGFVVVAQAVTGLDGMYYFRGVYPGQYILQVYPGTNYPLGVGMGPMQDIPIIRR